MVSIAISFIFMERSVADLLSKSSQTFLRARVVLRTFYANQLPFCSYSIAVGCGFQSPVVGMSFQSTLMRGKGHITSILKIS